MLRSSRVSARRRAFLWRPCSARVPREVEAPRLAPRRMATQLTARERQVAGLISLGLTNRQIAQRLVIAPRTADNHVQHIFEKLGLSSRAQLAAWVALSGTWNQAPGQS